MELRVLRYFLAVAQEQSISGAAEYLHLTQPTLSRQLMDLEDELGKKLFVRGSRKVTLTEDGILLRKRANEILELVEKTEADFHRADDEIAGDIFIGGGESESMRLLARTACRLQKEYPRIRYHLFSGSADDVCERLDKGLLDFGVLVTTADAKKYDMLTLPQKDTFGVLMRKDSPLAAKTCIRPEDLRDVPLLLSPRETLRRQIAEWIGADLDTLNVTATFGLLYNASLMVEEGMGYALTLGGIVNTGGSSVLTFRPLEPSVQMQPQIIWKKYQVFSKPAALFLERLQQEYGQE
jgi:DNA-binding transcriptional LysR family regulator